MIKIYKLSVRIFFFLFISILAACSVGSRANVDKPVAPNLLSTVEGEEEEYELIIIDPGYQNWKITNSRPVNFYSPSYYETWNKQYVAAWNEKVNQQARYNSLNYPFENRIDYNPHIDYGVELNHELFWYFRYIQHLYGALYNFPGFALR